MNNTTAQPQPSNQTPTHKRTPTSAVFGKLKNIPKWLIVTIVALFVAGLAYLLFRPEPVPPNYLTATAEMGDIEETVMATGKVKAIDSVAVGAQVSGEVTKLYVDVGSEVKQGDLIAQIDENSQSNAWAHAGHITLQRGERSRLADYAAERL